MCVKAYLDLSLSLLCSLVVASGPVHLGAWLGGSWLPWRAVPFFVCCGFVWFCFSRDSVGMVLFHCFTFSPAQWASPQLNGPVQLFHNLFWTRQLTDRAILANRQTQEKKSSGSG